MVNSDTIRNILGIVGNISSFFLFLSPAHIVLFALKLYCPNLPTILKIWEAKSVGEFAFHPIVAGIMNCVMWVFYSMPFVHPHSILVTTINSLGLAMYIGFNIIYLLYADINRRKSMVMYYIAEVIFLATLAIITMLAFHSHTTRSAFVGIFCDIFGVILYGSPLTVMWKVIRTKSVEFMPPSLSLAGFVNGVVWSVYAFIRFDPYILVGNGIGAFLGFIQLVIYGCYYKSTPNQDRIPVSTGVSAV